MAFVIVHIDSEDYIHQHYGSAFALKGWDVHVAKNGKSGIELIKKHKPNVVIMDLIVSGFNGFEVLEMIKKNPELCHIPVVIISDLEHEDDRMRVQDIGVHEYFIKQECDRDTVIRCIEYLKK